MSARPAGVCDIHQERMTAMRAAIRPDVRFLAPFMKLWGFNPANWADVEGVAITLSQVELVGDEPYDGRYDPPVYRLRKAGERIVEAISECFYECHCDECTAMRAPFADETWTPEAPPTDR